MDAPLWQDVFKVLIILFVAIAGSPFTQWVKIVLSKIFKKPIEDRLALTITGLVSVLFAVLEMWLAGILNIDSFILENFPATFFAVFSVSSIYFGWLKGSEGFFGKKVLLKPIEA